MLELAERIAGLEYAKILAERRALAQENDRTEYKSVNGIGELKARISLGEYFAARKRYGEDCWDDPEFTKAYIRDNPEVRVRITRGTRGQEYSRTRPLPPGTIFVPPSYAK